MNITFLVLILVPGACVYNLCLLLYYVESLFVDLVPVFVVTPHIQNISAQTGKGTISMYTCYEVDI